MKSALVVDDNAMNRRLARAFLELLKWQVEECEDGFKALEWLKDHPVDAVLLDISMPNMTGEEVCKRIRQDPQLKTLRVVAYTAHAMQEDVGRFIELGFDQVLIKPVSLNDMKGLFS